MKKALENELRDLSPFLADLKKQQANNDPFKVPTLYFDNLANAVELREASPFLADFKKQYADNQPFKVPKFYFDTLADTVLAQTKTAIIVENKAKQTPQYAPFLERLQGFFASVFQPKWAISLAALALVATVGWYALTKNTTTNTVVPIPETIVLQPQLSPQTPESITPQTIDNQLFTGLEDVPKADIHAYINDNLSDFDEALLVEHAPQLAEIIIKKEALETPQLTHPKSGLTEEELEMYLKENAEEDDSDGSNNKF